MIIGISGLISSGKDTVAECIQAFDCWHNQYAKKLTEFEDCDDIQFCKLMLERKFRGENDFHKKHTSWSNKKFATKLKQIASILFDCNAEDWENIDFKNSPLPPEWQVEGEETRTYRHALITIGTECIRDHYNQNAWILSMFNQYKTIADKYPDGHYSNICSICGKIENNCNKRMTICRKCFELDSYPKWIISDARFFNEINAIKERGGYMVRVDRGDLTLKHSSELEWQSYNDWDFIIDNSGDYEHLIKQVKDMLIKFRIINTVVC